MIQHITNDLYQIGECVPGENGHEAVRVYVLINEGRPILIDCGSHLHRTPLMAELDRLLEGSAPEYVFLTHSELPHSGNLRKITARWPAIRVIVSNVLLPYIELAPVLPLEQITTANPGSSHTFAGRTLKFLDALLKDQPGSQWILDPETRTLFTGDGFGYYHLEGACELFSDEIPGGITEEQFRLFHRNAFRFLRWVLYERFAADLERLFERQDIGILAPIHGNAIRDVPAHLERLKRAIASICREYRQTGVGRA